MMDRWCSSCTRVVPVEDFEGCISCSRCGKVLEEDLLSNEVTFEKDQAGRSRACGNLVRQDKDSRERTLDKAYGTIVDIAEALGVGGGDQICLPAKRFYLLALNQNFTRGRRADHVAAACLYIACRVNDKPFLLIEFSEILRVSVYVLGAVFLQLCRLLQLTEHPIVQKPVDPSLFIRRFTNVLLGEANFAVEKAAARIIASMKRDWMQTGRKPSGICGAALYISALSHGFKFSKADVVRIVHICEATLTKRLIEFEGTESGCLTIEQFTEEAEKLEQKARELESCIDSGKLVIVQSNKCEEGELLCQHKGTEERHFAHGLCGSCYKEFTKISGGLDGGSEPPAFQRAERERLAEKEAKRLEAGRNDQLEMIDPIGIPGEHGAVDGSVDESGKADYLVTEGNESESLSDIDDAEVDGYLHNEEEKYYKKIIWEDLNWEYLKEQAEKAALAAQKEANMAASFQNCSAEMLAAHELAAAAIGNAAKSRKERQQKRAAEAKTPKTAAEASHQALKKISSKVNYDKLKELFGEPEEYSSAKKSRTEIREENFDLSQTMNNDAEDDEDGLVTMGGYEGNNYEDYQDYSYYENEGAYEDFNDEPF